MVDFAGDNFASDDDSLSRAPSLNEWARLINEAANKFGKRFDATTIHRQWMIDQGFSNVKQDIYKVCLTWITFL